jgi:hypothetical protein
VIDRRSGDLIVVIVTGLLAAIAAIFVESGPVAVALLLPLVLFLPGYALSACLFTPGAIDRDFRLLLSVALSISVTALTGVVLQVFVNLGRGAFIAALAAITIGAAAKAIRLRAGEDLTGTRNLSVPRWAVPAAIAIGVAMAITGVAVAIATSGVERQLDEAHFTSLWLVPQREPGRPPNSPPVAVGVANHTPRELLFHLKVGRGKTTIRTWTLRLRPGEEWGKTLSTDRLRGPGVLVAQLSQEGHTVRRVALQLEPPAGGAQLSK